MRMESSKGKESTFGLTDHFIQDIFEKALGRAQANGNQRLRIMNFIWVNFIETKSKETENMFGTTVACTKAIFSMI